MNELKDTIELMTRDDYKDRFKAEYYQLKIRLTKLKTMLSKWDSNELEFVPTCPRAMYDTQVYGMEQYLTVLEERAQMEGIDLGW